MRGTARRNHESRKPPGAQWRAPASNPKVPRAKLARHAAPWLTGTGPIRNTGASFGLAERRGSSKTGSGMFTIFGSGALRRMLVLFVGASASTTPTSRSEVGWLKNGGHGRIRTCVALADELAFQASAFGLSATCPKLSTALNYLWRRERDSNSRTLSGQRFSRPPQSAALPPLLVSVIASGRGGGPRTPNLWFWRPALCQLSYAPPATIHGSDISKVARAEGFEPSSLVLETSALPIELRPYLSLRQSLLLFLSLHWRRR